MSAILINPSSASFTSNGGNGSIALSVETDSWHDEPQDGDIWMAQRKKTDGEWSDWIVFRIVGEKGEDGTGAAPVFQGVYSSSKTYYGNSTRRDIVKYSNQYWIAKQDAPSSSFSNKTPSSGSLYWDSFGASFESVATDLLLAEYANVANFIFQNEKMVSQSGGLTLDGVNGIISLGTLLRLTNSSLKMYDDSGKEKLLITGDDLGAMPVTSKTFSSGTMTGTSYDINSTNTLVSSFSVSSSDNTVEVPTITVDVFKSATSDTINASASLLIDNTVVSHSPTYNGVPDSRHIYLTIPSTAVSLSTGSHSFKIQAQASSLNGTLSSISYPSSSNSGTLDISYNSAKVQIGANGFRAAFGASNYAEFVNDSTPLFIFRAGNYALRITSSGIQKSSNMNATTPSWTTL